MSKWIRVEDDRPKDGQRVLVIYNNEILPAQYLADRDINMLPIEEEMLAYFYVQEWIEYPLTGNEGFVMRLYPKDISGWTPLPEFPKDGEI